QVRQELWALIDGLRQDGVSILMSTHYIEEAERLCDTVTIMAKGAAVASGVPSELVREHAGERAWEVYGPPATLEQVEAVARGEGRPTRRTGTSVTVLGGDAPPAGYEDACQRRDSNLEDVFVLLTGEEVS
ncbi:MAG: transporter ATP-binding protein, partial [Thermoleophilia bacterium]|nr:transporter ATP-binding protein [Thermoleophilia bacterium]